MQQIDVKGPLEFAVCFYWAAMLRKGRHQPADSHLQWSQSRHPYCCPHLCIWVSVTVRYRHLLSGESVTFAYRCTLALAGTAELVAVGIPLAAMFFRGGSSVTSNSCMLLPSGP